jgi:hypothetical protein
MYPYRTVPELCPAGSNRYNARKHRLAEPALESPSLPFARILLDEAYIYGGPNYSLINLYIRLRNWNRGIGDVPRLAPIWTVTGTPFDTGPSGMLPLYATQDPYTMFTPLEAASLFERDTIYRKC